jgi:hypothetical protein
MIIGERDGRPVPYGEGGSMIYPKLMVRPRSTHTAVRFGGLWHNELEEQGALGLAGASTVRWYDLRNLGPGKAPMMSVMPGNRQVQEVDGNELLYPAVAVCGGEHPVILDEHGVLHCNGHSVQTIGTEGVVYSWSIKHVDEYYQLRISPESGSTTDPTALGGLVTRTEPLRIYCSGTGDNPENMQWYYNDATFPTGIRSTYRYVPTDHYSYQWDLYDLGITVASIAQVDAGDYIEINFSTQTRYDAESTYMVRMGANVIILPDGIMVNAAKLEAGDEVEVECINSSNYLNNGGFLTLQPCLLDGTIVVPEVGTTAPVDTTKIWADTTGDKTVMRQWVSALSSWQAMQQTYVRIDIGDLEGAIGWLNDEIRQWDAIKLRNNMPPWTLWTDLNGDPLDTRTDDEIAYMLNSSQVIYKVGEDNGSPYIVVQGILDKGVSVSSSKDGSISLARQMPQMDFVVECGNRLWGCYYGKNEDGEILNEIYASKLGDPRNWSCYMGLSTDSWTVSRGRTAPFTGAAVLNGSPLFFRQDCVEKVYPSASGAHQVQTFDLDGIQEGAARTALVIDEKLYYVSRVGVMVYAGSLPTRISGAFGAWSITGLCAGRYRDRYVLSAIVSDEQMVCDYDVRSGEWYLREEEWSGVPVECGKELFVQSVGDVSGTANYWIYDGNNSDGIGWSAESGILGYELPEHRYISCIRIRCRLGEGALMRVHVRYDDGAWQQKAEISGKVGKALTREINVYPLRCDHFQLSLDGSGVCDVVSISYRMERSEGGH